MESKVQTHLEIMAEQASQRRDKYLGYLMTCPSDEFSEMYQKYKQSKKESKACKQVLELFQKYKSVHKNES